MEPTSGKSFCVFKIHDGTIIIIIISIQCNSLNMLNYSKKMVKLGAGIHSESFCILLFTINIYKINVCENRYCRCLFF